MNRTARVEFLASEMNLNIKRRASRLEEIAKSSKLGINLSLGLRLKFEVTRKGLLLKLLSQRLQHGYLERKPKHFHCPDLINY